MSLAKPMLDYYLGLLRVKGLTDQGRTPARKVRVAAILSDDGLTDNLIPEVWAALPLAPEPPKPVDPAPPAVPALPPQPPTERSKEIAAIFRKARGEGNPKKGGLKAEPKRIELRAENQFRIYQPAPVVAINRYGTVRWVADGRQHKAGQLIQPRTFQGKLTVRFRYDGEQVERLVGSMLETVGWVKRKAQKKAQVEAV